MSAVPAAPLAPCREPHCRTCAPATPPRQIADVIELRGHQRATSRPRSVYWRRRIVAVAVVPVVLLALGSGISRLVAAPIAVPQAGGSAVVEPGDTLWDLAVEHTPTGEDVRVTLRDIQLLNGFESATVPAWTVVLLPATD